MGNKLLHSDPYLLAQQADGIKTVYLFSDAGKGWQQAAGSRWLYSSRESVQKGRLMQMTTTSLEGHGRVDGSINNLPKRWKRVGVLYIRGVFVEE